MDTPAASVVDLTGQPYAPPDRGTTDALATVPGISLAIVFVEELLKRRRAVQALANPTGL
ncbi:MAG: hypothetical protein ACRDRO_14715 [Pseudonocardiaceae bacterium]